MPDVPAQTSRWRWWRRMGSASKPSRALRRCLRWRLRSTTVALRPSSYLPGGEAAPVTLVASVMILPPRCVVPVKLACRALLGSSSPCPREEPRVHKARGSLLVTPDSPRASGSRVEVTVGPCWWCSCCSVVVVSVEDLAWGATTHEVAVILAARVVGHEPAVEFGAQLGEPVESPAMKCWPPALLQGGALEPFAHRVVVRRSGRCAVMADPELGQVAAELVGDELGTVVGEDTGHSDPEAAELADHTADELLRDLGVARADEHLDDRPAGRGIDRGELPDRPDTFEFADEEAVQGDQITGPGGEMTEPERSLERIFGHESGGRGGELGERSDALATPAELVTVQDLLHPTRREREPLAPKCLGVAARTQRGSHDRFGEQFLDNPARCRVRHRRHATPLGHQRIKAVHLNPVLPPIEGGAAHAEHSTRLRHVRLGRMLHDMHTPLIDDLCWGHGDGLLRLCERNQRVHRRGPQT